MGYECGALMLNLKLAALLPYFLRASVSGVFFSGFGGCCIFRSKLTAIPMPHSSLQKLFYSSRIPGNSGDTTGNSGDTRIPGTPEFRIPGTQY
jgi:hypothetical protein